MLMGLIRLTSGSAKLLGQFPSRAARFNIGFRPRRRILMTAVTSASAAIRGSVVRRRSEVRMQRADALIERSARQRAEPEPQEVPGVLQRAGSASADERSRAGRARRTDERPRSDGCKEVRDLILSYADRGKMVFFRLTSCRMSRRSPIALRSPRAAS
jgi:hypothetical protein